MTKYNELTKNRVLLKDKVPLATPFGIYLDPTNFCNFKCSFCPRNLSDFHDYAGEYMHMKLELFKKIILDLHEFNDKLKVLRLYYLGEPLLNPNFIQMLELAMSENIAERIEITTNASLLNCDMAKKILTVAKQNSSVNLYMRYSIYATEQTKKLRVTKNPITTEQIRSNVENFQKQKQEMAVTNVSTYAKMLDTFDKKENDIFFEAYRKIVDDCQLEEPMNWSGDDNTNLLISEYDEQKIAQLQHNKDKTQVPCQYPFTTISINPDGSCIICCVDWTRKTYIGDVTKQSLKDIWNGDKLREIRKLHLDGKRCEISACKNCTRLPVFMAGHDNDKLDTLTTKEFLSRENTLLNK